MKYHHFTLTLLAFSFISCKKVYHDAASATASDDVIVIKASGDIHAQLDDFRHLLGDQLNTTTGVTGGRREINWDGVPDSLVGKALPDNFFNPVGADAPVGRQRGLIYSAGGEFRVSNANFTEVNSQAASQFAAFSGNKTFANISRNLWEVGFDVAGESKAATVKGFGVVLSDVDLANSTSLEFFHDQKSLGKFFAPAHDGTSSFSFLGVYFKNEVVTQVRVSHDGILSDGQKDITDGGPHDLIILDDFLYSEPVAK